MENLCKLAQAGYSLAYEGFEEITKCCALFNGIGAASDMTAEQMEEAESLARSAAAYLVDAIMEAHRLIRALRDAQGEDI